MQLISVLVLAAAAATASASQWSSACVSSTPLTGTDNTGMSSGMQDNAQKWAGT